MEFTTTVSKLLVGRRCEVKGASISSSSGTDTGYLLDMNGDMPWNLDGGEAAWTAESNVTAALETTIVRQGAGSAKFTVAAGFSTGLAAYKALTTPFDASEYDGLAFWVYSDTALAASALQVRLCNSSDGTSPLETLSAPAILATTWTLVGLAFSDPDQTSMEAINSVGLSFGSDPGAIVCYLDMITAVRKLWSRDGAVGKLRRYRPYPVAEHGIYAVCPSNKTMAVTIG